MSTPEESHFAPMDQTGLTPAHGLTPAQARLLVEVRRAGERTYNGRAAKTIRALSERGLVRYRMELVPTDAYRFMERWTVRPTHPDDPMPCGCPRWDYSPAVDPTGRRYCEACDGDLP